MGHCRAFKGCGHRQTERIIENDTNTQATTTINGGGTVLYGDVQTKNKTTKRKKGSIRDTSERQCDKIVLFFLFAVSVCLRGEVRKYINQSSERARDTRDTREGKNKDKSAEEREREVYRKGYIQECIRVGSLALALPLYAKNDSCSSYLLVVVVVIVSGTGNRVHDVCFLFGVGSMYISCAFAWYVDSSRDV